MLFLLTLVTFCSEQKVVTNLEEMYSLFSPAVDENGRSYRYSYHDDCVIKTYTSDQTYVQLGYTGGTSSGALETKKPIPFINLRTDTRFMIIPSKVPGDGFGVFISPKQFKSGTLLGRSDKFDDISVQIITKGKEPVIKLTIKDQVQTSKLDKEIFNTVCVLRVENFNKTLRVFMKIGEKEFTHIFNVYNSSLEKDSYFSISAQNTVGYNYVRIFDVKISSLVSIAAERIVKRSGGIYVWVIFFVGVAGLAYYLLKRQLKKPERML